MIIYHLYNFPVGPIFPFHFPVYPSTHMHRFSPPPSLSLCLSLPLSLFLSLCTLTLSVRLPLNPLSFSLSPSYSPLMSIPQYAHCFLLWRS